ncbi:hypothetical protein TGARI_213790B, partial [Toxoplasma gondii ARI]
LFKVAACGPCTAKELPPDLGGLDGWKWETWMQASALHQSASTASEHFLFLLAALRPDWQEEKKKVDATRGRRMSPASSSNASSGVASLAASAVCAACDAGEGSTDAEGRSARETIPHSGEAASTEDANSLELGPRNERETTRREQRADAKETRVDDQERLRAEPSSDRRRRTEDQRRFRNAFNASSSTLPGTRGSSALNSSSPSPLSLTPSPALGSGCPESPLAAGDSSVARQREACAAAPRREQLTGNDGREKSAKKPEDAGGGDSRLDEAGSNKELAKASSSFFTHLGCSPQTHPESRPSVIPIPMPQRDSSVVSPSSSSSSSSSSPSSSSSSSLPPHPSSSSSSSSASSWQGVRSSASSDESSPRVETARVSVPASTVLRENSEESDASASSPEALELGDEGAVQRVETCSRVLGYQFYRSPSGVSTPTRKDGERTSDRSESPLSRPIAASPDSETGLPVTLRQAGDAGRTAAEISRSTHAPRGASTQHSRRSASFAAPVVSAETVHRVASRGDKERTGERTERGERRGERRGEGRGERRGEGRGERRGEGRGEGRGERRGGGERVRKNVDLRERFGALPALPASFPLTSRLAARKSGSIWKHSVGSLYHQWTQRWLVLDGFLLKCYSDCNSVKPKTSVSLQHAIVEGEKLAKKAKKRKAKKKRGEKEKRKRGSGAGE